MNKGLWFAVRREIQSKSGREIEDAYGALKAGLAMIKVYRKQDTKTAGTDLMKDIPIQPQHGITDSTGQRESRFRNPSSSKLAQYYQLELDQDPREALLHRYISSLLFR